MTERATRIGVKIQPPTLIVVYNLYTDQIQKRMRKIPIRNTTNLTAREVAQELFKRPNHRNLLMTVKLEKLVRVLSKLPNLRDEYSVSESVNTSVAKMGQDEQPITIPTLGLTTDTISESSQMQKLASNSKTFETSRYSSSDEDSFKPLDLSANIQTDAILSRFEPVSEDPLTNVYKSVVTTTERSVTELYSERQISDDETESSEIETKNSDISRSFSKAHTLPNMDSKNSKKNQPEKSIVITTERSITEIYSETKISDDETKSSEIETKNSEIETKNSTTSKSVSKTLSKMAWQNREMNQSETKNSNHELSSTSRREKSDYSKSFSQSRTSSKTSAKTAAERDKLQKKDFLQDSSQLSIKSEIEVLDDETSSPSSSTTISKSSRKSRNSKSTKLTYKDSHFSDISSAELSIKAENQISDNRPDNLRISDDSANHYLKPLVSKYESSIENVQSPSPKNGFFESYSDETSVKSETKISDDKSKKIDMKNYGICEQSGKGSIFKIDKLRSRKAKYNYFSDNSNEQSVKSSAQISEGGNGGTQISHHGSELNDDSRNIEQLNEESGAENFCFKTNAKQKVVSQAAKDNIFCDDFSDKSSIKSDVETLDDDMKNSHRSANNFLDSLLMQNNLTSSVKNIDDIEEEVSQTNEMKKFDLLSNSFDETTNNSKRMFKTSTAAHHGDAIVHDGIFTNKSVKNIPESKISNVNSKKFPTDSSITEDCLVPDIEAEVSKNILTTTNDENSFLGDENTEHKFTNFEAKDVLLISKKTDDEWENSDDSWKKSYQSKKSTGRTKKSENDTKYSEYETKNSDDGSNSDEKTISDSSTNSSGEGSKSSSDDIGSDDNKTKNSEQSENIFLKNLKASTNANRYRTTSESSGSSIGTSISEKLSLMQNSQLNGLSDDELKQVKEQMDIGFREKQLKPSDVGFIYDKKVEFKPTENCDWDDSLSD